MALTGVRALVLRTFEFGETSQITHLLTLELGRVHAIAKGARRLGGAFHGGLDVLTEGRAAVYGRRATQDLHTLAGFEVTEHFPGLRARIPRFHNASHAAALVLAFAREEQPLPQVFELTVSLLRLLQEADDEGAATLGLGFEALLLALAGFAPALDRCVSCDRPARNVQDTRLSPVCGGLLCRLCRREDRNAIPLDGDVVATLAGLAAGPLAEAVATQVAPNLRRRVREALNGWTSAVIDRRLSTARFI